jgi:endoglucanase
MSNTVLQYTGVNLSGLEFGGTGGKLYYNYIIPGAEYYEHWAQDVGSNIVRIPFKWERLQPESGGELNADYLNLLLKSVEYAKANGMTAILDMHNYGSYFGQKIGSGNVDAKDLANAWIKLAQAIGNTPDVWLNLMNEPHGFNANQWAGYMQDVVYELRDAGIENKVMLSGTAWSGAHSWVKSGNAAAFEHFIDPLGNAVFDVHQYLDTWSTGTTGIAAEGVGSTALVAITQWAETHNMQLFLGEVGAADPTVQGQEFALSELQDLFAYMEAHNTAWLGWTLWGAGPWWPQDYHFNINPTAIRSDNPVHDSVISAILPEFEHSNNTTYSAEAAFDYDIIMGSEAKDRINGTADADKILAGSGNDVLYGHQGDDKLYGQSGHDFLDGRDGNDVLFGGSGNDHFMFSAHHDHIYDSSGTRDALYLRGSTAFENLSFAADGNDLIVTDHKLGSTVTIHDHFGAGTIERLREADGTIYDMRDGFLSDSDMF